MTLTVGSLFSGIGGIDLGLERAGMSVRWQVEIDPWCQRVLAKHWPDVARFSDVKEVGAHNLPPVDVIAGGFPCQDISYAGLGAGIKPGTRSGLWSEYARIVGELRPRYVFVENVPALLHRGIDVVLGDLAALGYDAEWDSVPASALGAPHRRDRVWIVAYASSIGQREPSDEAHALAARGEARAIAGRRGELADAYGERLEERRVHDLGGEEVSDSSGCRGCGAESVASCCAETLADSWGERGQLPAERGLATVELARSDHAPRGFGRRDWWAVEPAVGRVAHGIPLRVDRLRGLGNAVVPQIPEEIGRRIVAWEVNRCQ